jgi:hypothetical protein
MAAMSAENVKQSVMTNKSIRRSCEEKEKRRRRERSWLKKRKPGTVKKMAESTENINERKSAQCQTG